MGTAAQPTRENRTITVDFRSEATYFQLLGDRKAFLECVLAFILSLGFQLKHKATCRGGGCLTRHSHYLRLRLGGVTIWRLQCTTCKAVFTVLPHFVLRYRQMRPEVAREALSQITENRKVEARKPLIFQDRVFEFSLEKATLRQSPPESFPATLEYV